MNPVLRTARTVLLATSVMAVLTACGGYNSRTITDNDTQPVIEQQRITRISMTRPNSIECSDEYLAELEMLQQDEGNFKLVLQSRETELPVALNLILEIGQNVSDACVELNAKTDGDHCFDKVKQENKSISEVHHICAYLDSKITELSQEQTRIASEAAARSFGAEQDSITPGGSTPSTPAQQSGSQQGSTAGNG